MARAIPKVPARSVTADQCVARCRIWTERQLCVATGQTSHLEWCTVEGYQSRCHDLARSVMLDGRLDPRVELFGSAASTPRCIPGKAEYSHGTDSVQVERSNGAKDSAKRVKSA